MLSPHWTYLRHVAVKQIFEDLMYQILIDLIFRVFAWLAELISAAPWS